MSAFKTTTETYIYLPIYTDGMHVYQNKSANLYILKENIFMGTALGTVKHLFVSELPQ
jgi:hypothetical protein